MNRYEISNLCIVIGLLFACFACTAFTMAAHADGLTFQSFDTGPSIYWDRSMVFLSIAVVLFVISYKAVEDTLP